MAEITLVASGQDDQASNTTSLGPIDLDAAGYQADDLIVIYARSDEQGTVPVLSITGGVDYDTILNENPTTGRDRVETIFAKVLTASENDPSVAISIAQEHSMVWYIFRGVDPSTYLDVALQFNSGTNNINPTNPAITPVTDNACLLLLQGATHDDITVMGVPTTPASLVAGQAVIGGAADHRQICSCYKLDLGAAAVQTPSAWTNTGSPTGTAEWSVTTIALRPFIPPIFVLDQGSIGADGNTTDRLTGLTGTQVGKYSGLNNPLPSVTPTLAGHIEDVLSIKVTDDAEIDATYEFDVLYGGASADTVTQRPKIKVVAGGNQPLTSQAANFGQGSLGVQHDNVLGGQEVAVEQGTLTIVEDKFAALTGQQIATEQGSLKTDKGVPLTSQASNFNQGSVSVEHSNQLTGQEVATEQGVLTPGLAILIELTGQEIATTPGAIGVELNIAISGQLIATGQGNVTPLPELFVALNGLQIDFDEGDLETFTTTAAALIGAEIASNSGSLGVTLDKAIAGLEAAFGQGALTPSLGTITVPLTGQQVLTLQGNLTPIAYSLELKEYRYFGDGTESGSSPLAAQNAEISIDKGVNFQARFGAQSVGNEPPQPRTLQWREPGGVFGQWFNVASGFDTEGQNQNALGPIPLTGYQPDDVIIIFAYADGSGQIPVMSVSGGVDYNTEMDYVVTVGRDRVANLFMKRLTASEVSPSVEIDRDQQHSMVWYIVRGCDVDNYLDAPVTFNNGQSSYNPTNEPVTTVTDNTALLLLGGYAANALVITKQVVPDNPPNLTGGEQVLFAGFRQITSAFSVEFGAAGVITPSAWLNEGNGAPIVDNITFTVALRPKPPAFVASFGGGADGPTTPRLSGLTGPQGGWFTRTSRKTPAVDIGVNGNDESLFGIVATPEALFTRYEMRVLYGLAPANITTVIPAVTINLVIELTGIEIASAQGSLGVTGQMEVASATQINVSQLYDPNSPADNSLLTKSELIYWDVVHVRTNAKTNRSK